MRLSPVVLLQSFSSRGALAALLCVALLLMTAEAPRVFPTLPSSQVIAQVPLGFEANRGQAPPAFRYLTRQAGFSLGLTADAVTVALKDAHPLALQFVGARSGVHLHGSEAQQGQSHYLLGNDAADWHANVPRFGRVTYEQLYEGIDAVFYGRGAQLEYDWMISPHADAGQIKFTFAGADAVRLDEGGALVVEQGSVRLLQHVPVAFQDTTRGRQAVAVRYVIGADHLISFALDDYDATLPLVIDPILSYSTYLGGGNIDAAYAIATDAAGNIYVAGQTTSLNFPVRVPYEDTPGGGSDGFLTKLDPTGTRLLFSTYLGGRGSSDRVWSIAVDKTSSIYLSGETNSLNFPTTPTAPQPVARGNGDAFVTKLNPAGTALVYSTYLGGNQTDAAYALALDANDAAYVTGRTDSPNFLTRNPIQAALRGERDVFVAKFSGTGALLFSTYFGGDGAIDEEVGYGIAVDALQQAFVTGVTTTANFPTASAWQAQFRGEQDAFLAKFDTEQFKLLFSTYLGGNNADAGRAVVVDGFGNPSLTGVTSSLNFPIRNPMQSSYGGGAEAFVMKFRASGSAPLFSSWLGGRGDENTGSASEFIPIGNLAIDALGFTYLTGKTTSDNFPVLRGIQETRRGDNDAFVAKLTPAGDALVYSTYFGTSFSGSTGLDERGLDLVIDNQGTVYFAGQVLGSDLQTVTPLQARTNGGMSEAFVAKISSPDLATIAPVSSASYVGAALAPESIVTVFGNNLAAGTEIATALPLPTTLQGVTVNVTDAANETRPAPLFFVSPGQVNLLIPAGTVSGAATVTLSSPFSAPVSASVLIQPTAPALFTANADGTGVPAAFALRIKADGALSYEPVAVFDEVQQRFVTQPIDFGAETDQVFLVLFGSGLRNRAALSATTVRVGGVSLPPLYVGAQGGLVGLDQINVALPRTFAGRGNAKVEITVDGQIANAVTLNFR
jgi:uncharacterized protein (TIGR03437 family)